MKRMNQLRNLGIMAHVDAGKTTATERMLYFTGLSHQLGNVDSGNTIMDTDPQESKRGITIHSAAITTHWTLEGQRYQLNLIDTPGHVDFVAEVERSLRVLDGAVALFDARSGVEPQSETVWQQANRYRVPRIGFVNKMDREGADFFKVLEDMQTVLGARPIAIQIPVGEGKEFTGVIDLITKRYLQWDQENQGKTWTEHEIPESFVGQVQHWRQHLFEQLADLDLDFLEEYLEQDLAVDPEHVFAALRRVTLSMQAQPMLLGSAFHNMGVQPLLDAVIRYLPSPADIEQITGVDPDSEEELVLSASEEESFVGLAFKVLSDPYVGKMTMVRVYAGQLSPGDSVLNIRTGKRLRISRILRIKSEKYEAMDIVAAGEICALVGLKEVRTGDSLSAEDRPIVLEQMHFPEPVFGYAIEAKTPKDVKRMGMVLRKLQDEDPTLSVGLNQQTQQTILRGMGELHLEVVLERLRSEFDLPLSIGQPEVAFKEAISKTIAHKTRFKKQDGGKGHFAEIQVEISPGEAGQAGLVFINEVKGGHIPTAFIPSVQKGFELAMQRGPLRDAPMQSLIVRLRDGDFHSEDSKALDFEIAAQIAFREAVPLAGPVLLEPIMAVEVQTPEDHTGTVVGDINRRRGLLLGMEAKGQHQMIKAEVPLRNLFGYVNDLRTITAGRASSSMHFVRYALVPKDVLAAS